MMEQIIIQNMPSKSPLPPENTLEVKPNTCSRPNGSQLSIQEFQTIHISNSEKQDILNKTLPDNTVKVKTTRRSIFNDEIQLPTEELPADYVRKFHEELDQIRSERNKAKEEMLMALENLKAEPLKPDISMLSKYKRQFVDVNGNSDDFLNEATQLAERVEFLLAENDFLDKQIQNIRDNLQHTNDIAKATKSDK